MFKKFKSLNEAFKQVRWLSLGSIVLCAVISCWAIVHGFSETDRVMQRIYILSDGKVLEAMAADRRENVPVELRDHLRTFHRLFFDLDPDEKAIRNAMDRSFYLGDGSIKALYEDQVEKGFISGLISGNISQSVVLDSIWLDVDQEPYAFRCAGTQTLTRATSITTRSLITQGFVRTVERSDNNPHGFLIERFEVVENKDLKTVNR
jgi:conjugative transposon TraK protein